MTISQNNAAYSSICAPGSERSQVCTLINRYVPIVILAPAFAILFSLGHDLSIDGNWHINSSFIKRTGAYLVFFSLLFCCAKALLRYRAKHMPAVRYPSWWLVLSFRGIALGAVIVFACTLPVLIALYPGNLYWDTSYQISQFLGSKPDHNLDIVYNGEFKFSSYAPIFDTFVFGAFIWIGDSLGSQEIGLFACIFIQTVCTAVSFSVACCYLKSKLGLSTMFCTICLLFFSLFPLYPLAEATLAKDTFFGWTYVLYLAAFAECMRTRGTCLRNPRWIALLIVSSLLVVLTKSPGIYLVAASGLFLIIRTTAHRRSAIIAVMIPCVTIWAIYPLFVYPVFHVAPALPHETLGPLYQQTARYVHDHPDDVSPKEKAVLDAVLNYDTLAERYDWRISDAVKFGARNQTSENIAPYIQVYLAQGLRHPLTYMEGHLATLSGFFSFDTPLSIKVDSSHHFEDPDVPLYLFDRSPAQESVQQAFKSGWTAICELPGISLLMCRGMWCVVLPVFSLFLMWRSRKDVLWMAVPIFFSLFILFISPVSLPLPETDEGIRYVLPFLYTAPFVLGMARYALMNTESGTPDARRLGEGSEERGR